MNISSVNNLNLYQNKSVNFNGLWGKTISKTDFDTVIGTTKLTQDAYYYPFVDESQVQIDEVIAKNTSSQIINGTDGKRQLLIRNCKLCAPLPINSTQYEAYKKFDSDSEFKNTLKTVHVFLKDKFINPGFESLNLPQSTAVNSQVTDALIKGIDIVS